MLRTQQGLGVFVVATEPRHEVDLVAAITFARDTLGSVLGALTTGPSRAKAEQQVQVRVHGDDGRWAIRAPSQPWWTVSTHTEEQGRPVQVGDDWFGPGWQDLILTYPTAAKEE
jgi:hypothetical protein